MIDGVSYIQTTAQQEGQVNGKPQCLLSWWLPPARPEHPYLTRGVNCTMCTMCSAHTRELGYNTTNACKWPGVGGLAIHRIKLFS